MVKNTHPRNQIGRDLERFVTKLSPRRGAFIAMTAKPHPALSFLKKRISISNAAPMGKWLKSALFGIQKDHLRESFTLSFRHSLKPAV